MIENLYSADQVHDAAIKYFEGDNLATTVWMKKYALKSKEQKNYYLELTPNDTIERISKEIERIENKYDNPLSYKKIKNTLGNFKHFIFGGSILYGAGNDNYVSSLGNCFFVHNDADSYGGILNIDESLVQLMKRRGGVGLTLEKLRPKSSNVNNSAQTSTGIIPFAERYSNTTREVAQDGRRGALMISCFAPDTFVKTDNGWEYITKVIQRWNNGENPLAWTHEGMKEIEAVQEYDDQEIYEVVAENGKVIKVTADHEFQVRNIETKKEYLKAIRDIDVEKEELAFFGV